MNQFFRFVTVGFLNTALGYCIIFGCMYLAGLSAEISNLMGYGIGLVTSYVLNRHYTFKSKAKHQGEILRFVTVFAISYAANFMTLVLLIRKLGAHEGAAQIAAGAVYVLASYALNKLYVFGGASVE